MRQGGCRFGNRQRRPLDSLIVIRHCGIVNLKSERKKFTIIDNPDPAQSGVEPYCLIDDAHQILKVSTNPARLADWAFDMLSADEVRHDEDLIKARDRNARTRRT